MPRTILALRDILRSLPADLADASYVDGCTTFGLLRRDVAALRGTGRSKALDTTPGDRAFLGSALDRATCVAALVALVMIPAAVLCLLAERHIVAGLTGCAVRG